MRSPGAAFTWEVSRRHRAGFAGLGLYGVALAAARSAFGSRGGGFAFEDDAGFALATFVPLSAAVIYLLGVFSFGLSGNVAGRRSLFPERLFTLPVTSAALAGWPLVYGSGALAAVWFLVRGLAPWPPDAAVPVLWPALLAVVMLAWVQALTWTAYPLPGLRVAASVAWLGAVGTTGVLALELEVPEGVMLALLAPHVPVAGLLARRAVERARRGDAPDWGGLVHRLTGWAEAASGTGRGFRSASHAQEWLEWRRHGRSLPVLVALVVPLELWLLWALPDSTGVVRAVFASALATPPFMAAFAAASVSRSGPEATETWELTPFAATRPLTCAALVSARLKAAARGTVAAWLVVFATVPAALAISGTAGVVIGDVRWLADVIGGARAAAVCGLTGAALVLSTWKTMVAGLYVGMSGRAWLVKGSVFGTLALLTLVVAIAPRALRSPAVVAGAWEAAPWVLAALVALKTTSAAWIATRLRRARLVRDRALVLALASWDAAVLALHGALLWLLPTLVFRLYGLGLVAILAVPLVRVSGMPLMAAWNRHR